MVGRLQKAASGVSADSQIALEDAGRNVKAARLFSVALGKLFRYFALEAVKTARLRGADSVDQAILTLFFLGQLNVSHVQGLVGNLVQQCASELR